MGRWIIGLGVAVLAAASVSLSAECIDRTGPPLVVSGALCGTLHDATGAPPDGVEAELRTAAGDVAATAISDADGVFQFGQVPAGDYRITVEGFYSPSRILRLMKPSGSACTARLRVELKFDECISQIVSVAGLRLKVDAQEAVRLVLNGNDEYDVHAGADYEFFQLQPGEYQAELRADGYATRRFKFSIREFEVRTFQFAMRRRPGR